MSLFEQIRDDIKFGNKADALAKLEIYTEDINKQAEDGWTLLHWSVTLCDKITKKLLEMGADLNIKTLSFGWTALHRAVFWNNLEMAEFLVKAGSDLTIKNIDGETALDLAINYNYNDIITYLSEEIPLTKRAQ